jgi:hypothetical protein
MTNAFPGGVWSTASTAVAIIGGGSGILTGMSLGTTVVTYTLPTGCARTTVITVNPLPASTLVLLRAAGGLVTMW